MGFFSKIGDLIGDVVGGITGTAQEAGNLIGDVVGGVTGTTQQAQAAERAAGIQAGLSQQGIDEQRRQFDEYMRLMAPYLGAGTGALSQMQALSGLSGAQAQADAIRSIEQGPTFAALAKQGEEAMLQRAAATGGLRGGNLQAALAQFRPQMLQNEINSQYSRLAGLAQGGLGSAQNIGGQGMGMASNIGNLLGQMGAARAGGIMAGGSVPRQSFGDLLTIAPIVMGMFGGSGGGAALTQPTAIGGGGLGLKGPSTGFWGA